MSLITLSIPVYNVERYIKPALISALNQTYQNLEVLVVDDLGHDNSMNIVRQIKNTHPRGNCIRIITHEQNLGLGGTRNTAIEYAKGEYLYFMDSDDSIVPDCIESLYWVISKEKVDYVAGGIIGVDEQGNALLATNYSNIVRKGNLCMAKYFYEEKNEIWVTTWNKLYNLSFLRKFQIYVLEHVYHEDIALHTMLALKTRSFALINKPTYIYNYKRQDSITNKSKGLTNKHLSDIATVFGEIKKMIHLDKNISKQIRKEMNLYGLTEIYYRYLSALYANIDKQLLITGLARLSREGVPHFWETKLTTKSIRRFFFLKLPFCIQRRIKKRKY